MAISIITRSERTSELSNLINYLNSNSEIEYEIIAVCKIKDFALKNTKIIIENSNRFVARITGLENAVYDKILFLDSDQFPEIGLLKELDNKKEDMLIIPEKSIKSNFISKCLDDWRYRNERLARKKVSPYIPVVPRFYNRQLIINVVEKLPEISKNIIDHEDSILYYYAFREDRTIDFSIKHILNNDPNLHNLMLKAFLYGKNSKNMQHVGLPDDIKFLLAALNENTLNLKEIGLGKGYIIQILRGVFYELGKIIGE